MLDWLDLPKGTPARATATIHSVVMLAATVLLALTWLAQRPGYDDDEVRTLALVLALAAEGCWAYRGSAASSLRLKEEASRAG